MGPGKKLDRSCYQAPVSIRFASQIFSKVIFWFVLCLRELKLRGVDGRLNISLMVVIAQFNDALLQAATSLCGHPGTMFFTASTTSLATFSPILSMSASSRTTMVSASFARSNLDD